MIQIRKNQNFLILSSYDIFLIGYPAGYGPSSPQNQYGIQNGGGFHDSTYDGMSLFNLVQ